MLYTDIHWIDLLSRMHPFTRILPVILIAIAANWSPTAQRNEHTAINYEYFTTSVKF
jgi:hypothetical protein